ncbi:MAG: CapA family protein [Tannerellaceae bacterium]
MKIAFLGDIGLFGKFDLSNNQINYKEYFADVKMVLDNCDHIIGNLETPFITSHKPVGAKSAYIGSNTCSVELLKYLGIDIVNLANNHLFDFGRSSYLLTKKILEEYNIKYFGVEDISFKVINQNNKLAFSGYCCYSSNPIGLGKDGVNTLNYPAVYSNMKKFAYSGFLNILSVHAGQEHVNMPNRDHIKFARKLANEFDYIYYGHHPHVLQGFESYKDSLIAYSLGNFCFDDVYISNAIEPLIKQSDNNKSSVILIVEIENNQIVSSVHVPIYIGENKMVVGSDIISDKIKEYNKLLSLPFDKYQDIRSARINKYVDSRKALRNKKWYFSRMKLRYVRMVYDLFRNKHLYKKNVLKYIK